MIQYLEQLIAAVMSGDAKPAELVAVLDIPREPRALLVTLGDATLRPLTRDVILARAVTIISGPRDDGVTQNTGPTWLVDGAGKGGAPLYAGQERTFGPCRLDRINVQGVAGDVLRIIYEPL